MAKPRGNDDEILFMADLKRKAAHRAMCQIAKAIGETHDVPDVAVLLEYLTNMVYALELMLKLRSNNWTKHDFPGMYQKVFKKPHSHSNLMNYLDEAVRDQKYDTSRSTRPFQVPSLA